MNNADYFRELGINHVYISSTIKNIIKHIFFDYYNLIEYNSNCFSTLFIGLKNNVDIEILKNHKGLIYLILLQEDFDILINKYDITLLKSKNIINIYIESSLFDLIDNPKVVVIDDDSKVQKILNILYLYNKDKDNNEKDNENNNDDENDYKSKEIYNNIEFRNKIQNNIQSYILKSNTLPYILKSNFIFDPNFSTQCIKLIPIGYNIFEYYHQKGIKEGVLINPLQLKLWYPDVDILEQNNNIYVKYNDQKYSLYDFHQKYFINQDLKFFLIPKDTYQKINNDYHKIVIILHCGNMEIAEEIIDLLINNKLNKYLLAISYYDDDVINQLSKKINSNFNEYFIIKTNNLGSDITPSLILYHNLKQIISFDLVMKLHTKTNDKWRNELILPLIKNMDAILDSFNNNKYIAMICAKKWLLNFDQHCSLYAKEILNTNDIGRNKKFCGGTCFINREKYWEKILYNISESITKSLFFFPYYICNSIFKNNSPPHTYERIFGYIIDNNDIILGV